jgi:hypothetical protein
MELLQQLFCYKINESDSDSIILCKRQRQQEHDDCFKHNVSLPFISRHHIFLEDGADKEHYSLLAGKYIDKCVFILLGRQAHYKDYFIYIKDSIIDNTMICIMNGDLFIDGKLPIALIDKHLRGNIMFGISRHEFTDSEHTVCNAKTCELVHAYCASFDTFCVRTPLLKDIKIDMLDHRQNLYGAENITQYVLHNAGYISLNPCFDFRTFHNHKDSVYFENYSRIDNHIMGEFRGSAPSKLT